MNLFRKPAYYKEAVEDEDAHLIRDVKAGDKESFRVLMNKYSHFVGVTVYKVLWNKEDAEDAVQETFIKVWKSIRSYNGDSRFSTWLYKIAVNTAYDNLRSLKRRNEIFFTNSDEKLMNFAGSTNENFEEKICETELASIVLSLAEKLSPVQRIVFSLVDIEKMKLKEAAEILDISLNSVKVNLHHARKNIREKLAKYIHKDLAL